MISQLASRYNILSTLGEGGMGSVFLVEDTASGTRVALKVLSNLSAGEESILRFKQEFRTMTRLRHPNTVEVYDYGQLPDGTPYFTMEVVPGKGLDELLPLSPDQVEKILIQLSQALGFIHSQGLVHCDIKPENIRIKEDGTLKLMDFGLMEAAGQSGGSIKGTLAYMAPEVCKRGRIDHRADLYSLGALAYHLLAGSPPFKGGSPLEIIKAHLETLPDPLGTFLDAVPSHLDRLILRLLSKDPARRLSSTSAVLSELGVDSGEERAVLLTSPFVGRKKEFEELLSLLNGVMEEKHGQLVWVTGNPGIGKSRLMEELRFQVQLMDLPYLVGSSYEEGNSPYGPIVEALRQSLPFAKRHCPELLSRHLPVLATLLPEIEVEKAVPLEPKEEKLRLQAAVTELLAAISVKKGLVLDLEDWQWADPLSLELLEYLARNLEGVPLLVCGTTRTATGLSGSKIELTAFSVEEVRKMVSAILGEDQPSSFAAQLCDLAGGNPFFTESFIKNLVDRSVIQKRKGHWATADLALTDELMPSSLADLLWEQFDRLKPETLAFLKLCAAIGPRFKLTLLQALEKGENFFDGLAELGEAGILVYRDGVYAFSQRQYVDVLYASLDERNLVELHSRIAVALEAVSDPSRSEDLNELARHFLKSDFSAKAVSYALAAGKSSFSLFALEDARAFLEAGYAKLDEVSELRLEYQHLLGDIYRYSSELEAAEKNYGEALALAGEDLCLTGRLLTSLGLVFQVAAQYEKAKEIFEKAIALSKEAENPREVLRAQTSLSRVFFFTGETEEAIAQCEDALALSHQTGDESYLSQSLGFLGMLYVSADPDRIPMGLDYLNQSLKIKHALGDKIGLNDSYMLLGNAQLALGRFKEAQASFEENQRLAREIGNADEVLYSHLNLALVAYERGDFKKSIEQAEVVFEESAKTGNAMCEGMALSLKAIASLYLGRVQPAQQWIEKGLLIAQETSSKYLEIMVLVAKVEIALLLGRLIDALEAANQASALIVETGITEHEGKLAALRGEIFGRLGEAESSDALWMEARALGQKTQSQGVICRALIGTAKGQLLQGKLSKAREGAEEACRIAAEIGTDSLLCEAKTLLGDSLFRQSLGSAAQHYRDAMELAEKMECPNLFALSCFRLALTYGRNADAYLLLLKAQDSLQEQLRQLSEVSDDAVEDYLSLEERWCIKQGDLSFQVSPADLSVASEQSTGFSDLGVSTQARFANLERKYLDVLSDSKQLHSQLTETQQANRVLENIMRFAREISRLGDIEEVLQAVTSQLVEIVGAERGFLLLLDEEGKLKCRVSVEPPGSPLMWSYSQSVVEKVLKEGQSIYLADAMQEEGFNTQQSVVNLQIRTVMCVPIKVRGVLIGEIYVDRQTVNESFSARDLILAESLAMHASSAIENARLYSESKMHARQLEMLNSLAKSISTTLVMSEVLDLVMSFTLKVTAADRGFILLRDDYTDLLHFYSARDKDNRDLNLSEVKISQSICQKVLGSGESICVVDALADEELQMQASIMALSLRTVMCVPLQVKNESLGVLYVDSQAVVNAFTKQDLDVLASIASHASVSIENARLYEKATVDGLTKLYFRSYFESRLAAEVRRTQRFATKLSLMMLDIDHFKKFNDTYGHQTGDEVLKLVSSVIREGVRTDLDIPARYGGEEMLVLMPETDTAGAVILAERLREAIAATDLPGPNGEILHVYVSIGVATLPTHADAPSSLIEKADQALYHSKRNGRNQVTAYSPDLNG